MNPSTERVQRTATPPGPDGVVPPGVPPGPGEGARPALGLWDAVSIIIGIVVGAGIYQTAPLIFKNTGSPATALVAWGAAGLLSLVGALCYAELATAYPRDGGDIIYLSRAYGNWLGFLFGWVQLTVLLTGSIGMMAFIFANYATRFVQAAFGAQLGLIAGFAFAGGAVLLLTAANVAGVVFGKTVQNVLSLAKVLGLGAIIAAGFYAPSAGAWQEPSTAAPGEASLGLAMILILYTFGGWNDAAFVAAEVRDGKRNLTRALVLGILIVSALYLLVNAAYVTGLGFARAQQSDQVAADVLQRGFGRGGETLMCVLVMVSALGAINGLIFTGARVYSTIGRQYSTLSWMGGWSSKHGTPVPALVTQGGITLALIFLMGTTAGREAINTVLRAVRLTEIGWGKNPTATDAFNTLLACTSPVFWAFFLLTGLSVFILRENDRATPRPFKVPLYPELPLLFCATCAYMLYSSVDFALFKGWKGGLLLTGVLPLLVGIPIYRLSRRLDAPGPAPDVRSRELAGRPA
jgi:basic amino acid/polyamine antiporter, APA family